MNKFGVSFSVKYAREIGVEPKECLLAALEDLGVRRLRFMSYWDEHETTRGSYEFSALDWQIDMAEQYGAEVTLCLGLRQPRWPESHWPEWSQSLSEKTWQKALLEYIEAVVDRYKNRKCIISYQLENEAMLKKFGLRGNFDRKRLRREMALIRKLDPERPIIMTCSDSWGMPWFGPKPDMYGFSVYRYFFDKGMYRHSKRPAWFYAVRALTIRLLKRRSVFIHELQAEPWGLKQTYDMTIEEQYKSMNPDRVREAIEYALATKLHPVDAWGLEWWYWLKTKHSQDEIWDYLRNIYKN